MRTRSGGVTSFLRIRWPLTQVPLVDPRSSISQPASVRVSTACCRLTVSPVRRTTLPAPLPMVMGASVRVVWRVPRAPWGSHLRSRSR